MAPKRARGMVELIRFGMGGAPISKVAPAASCRAFLRWDGGVVAIRFAMNRAPIRRNPAPLCGESSRTGEQVSSRRTGGGPLWTARSLVGRPRSELLGFLALGFRG